MMTLFPPSVHINSQPGGDFSIGKYNIMEFHKQFVEFILLKFGGIGIVSKIISDKIIKMYYLKMQVGA